MGKVVKKAAKAVTKPFKKVAKAVTRGVSKVFKAIKTGAKSLGGYIAKPFEKLGKALKPDVPDVPDQKLPAPPAPDAEQYADDVSTPENIGRKRRKGGRSGLRIDLNTGGSAGGQGVNVAVG